MGAQSRPSPAYGVLQGRVIEDVSGAPVTDAEVRLGSDQATVTDSLGFFSFPAVRPGEHLVTVSHLAYGTHAFRVLVGRDQTARYDIRVSQEAVRLAPMVVEVLSDEEHEARTAGYQINRVTRSQIARLEGSNMDLGDLLNSFGSGIRVRRNVGVVGYPICIEFRGATQGNFIRGSGGTDPGCNSPDVYLDGVLVSNPSNLYGTIPLETIESIQMVPPSEAGARFGTGALWGALLIESRRPGAPRKADPLAGSRTPERFDWTLDPAPYPARRVFFTTMAANAVGLVAGTALGGSCIGVRDPTFDSVVSECGGTRTMLTAVGAVGIPAVLGTVAAWKTGRTETSEASLAPSLIAGTMVLTLGYAFHLSSRRDDTHGVEAMGLTILVVGTPLVETVANRIFRRLR